MFRRRLRVHWGSPITMPLHIKPFFSSMDITSSKTKIPSCEFTHWNFTVWFYFTLQFFLLVSLRSEWINQNRLIVIITLIRLIYLCILGPGLNWLIVIIILIRLIYLCILGTGLNWWRWISYKYSNTDGIDQNRNTW